MPLLFLSAVTLGSAAFLSDAVPGFPGRVLIARGYDVIDGAAG
jgi:hypothetical protein